MVKPSLLVVIFLLFIFISLTFQSLEEPPAVWQDLTPTEIKQWYTPTDLCMLQSEDRASYPQTVRAEKCAAVSGGVRKLQCGVGFSGSSIGNKGAPCFPPFVSRSSFLKGKQSIFLITPYIIDSLSYHNTDNNANLFLFRCSLSLSLSGIVGYTDPLPKPLLEMLWHLHRANLTMVWLGDSLMRQKLAALECEVLREYPLLSSTPVDSHHGWVKSVQVGEWGGGYYSGWTELQQKHDALSIDWPTLTLALLMTDASPPAVWLVDTQRNAQVGYTGCHQKLTLRLPMSAFMFLLQPYNTNTSSRYMTPSLPHSLSHSLNGLIVHLYPSLTCRTRTRATQHQHQQQLHDSLAPSLTL